MTVDLKQLIPHEAAQIEWDWGPGEQFNVTNVIVFDRRIMLRNGRNGSRRMPPDSRMYSDGACWTLWPEHSDAALMVFLRFFTEYGGFSNEHEQYNAMEQFAQIDVCSWARRALGSIEEDEEDATLRTG